MPYQISVCEWIFRKVQKGNPHNSEIWNGCNFLVRCVTLPGMVLERVTLDLLTFAFFL